MDYRDVKPGELVGPMLLPASFRREGAGRQDAPNSGTRKMDTRKSYKTKSDRIPVYHYNF